MKTVITGRKVEKKNNIEFQIEFLDRNWFDKFVMYVFSIPKSYTISKEQLIEAVSGGEKIYTINVDKTYTEVEVVNGKKTYVRSVGNEGTVDNIDTLPIYL